MPSGFNIATVYKYIIFIWLINIENWFIDYKLFINNYFIFFQFLYIPWNNLFSPIAKILINIFNLIIFCTLRTYHFHYCFIQWFQCFLKLIYFILLLGFFKSKNQGSLMLNHYHSRFLASFLIFHLENTSKYNW